MVGKIPHRSKRDLGELAHQPDACVGAKDDEVAALQWGADSNRSIKMGFVPPSA